jgi:enhancer of mRNA-decapping protein 3
VQKKKTFDDPAILSVGRRPTPQDNSATSTPPQIQHPILSSYRQPSRTSTLISEKEVTPPAILVETFEELELGNGDEDAQISDVELPTNEPKRSSKRGPRRRQRRNKQFVETDGELPAVPQATQTNPAKGWRQTPLLEPNPSFQPFATLKNKKGKKYDNGWATEDATDVQDMGDFDFQSNLSKFDKRTVFEGIRADDATADEDRLVGHNRLPKAGTAGGKNLHHTENVLDVVNKTPEWNSEAGDSDVENNVSQRGSGSGRTSRRAESRLRMPAKKKESSVTSSQPPRTVPGLQHAKNTQAAKSGFYLVPSDKRCEIASALQMLNIENIADRELGLTEDMMTENAARGIAEVALSALDKGGSRLTQGNTSTLPYVVIYAGNNKSGMRAIAAGRHLRNHGASVVVCVLGLEREPEHLEGVRRQLKVFRSFGGKVFTKVELMEYIKSLAVPVELIIDGLLGLTISFEELRTGDQATAYELIEYANRSKAAVLAIDIPTGIDPSTGKVQIIDGNPLYIHAKFVVAMGVPKNGLLHAMALGEGVSEGRAWQLFVADIGISKHVWKKAGMRMRRGLEFEGAWVVGIRFQKGLDV